MHDGECKWVNELLEGDNVVGEDCESRSIDGV